MFYGQSEELVYQASNPDEYLSQLLWDIKPLWYYGSSLSYGLEEPLQKAGLFAEIFLRAGIPAKTGVMEDRDWMAPDNQLSHFSSHINFTRGAMLADAGLGFTVPIQSRLWIKAGLWFSYMWFSWDSQDGYLQHAAEDFNKVYEVWNEQIPKVYLFGPAISYLQSWYALSPGLSLQLPLSSLCRLGISILWSPWILVMAQDIHHSKPDVQFLDRMSAGAMLFEPRGEVTFSPHKKLALSWFIAYRYISQARGPSKNRKSITSSDAGGGPYSNTLNESGAAYRVLETGISCTLRL
jgi:outer membrane protease